MVLGLGQKIGRVLQYDGERVGCLLEGSCEWVIGWKGVTDTVLYSTTTAAELLSGVSHRPECQLGLNCSCSISRPGQGCCVGFLQQQLQRAGGPACHALVWCGSQSALLIWGCPCDQLIGRHWCGCGRPCVAPETEAHLTAALL
jgi:hypothetical protein